MMWYRGTPPSLEQACNETLEKGWWSFATISWRWTDCTGLSLVSSRIQYGVTQLKSGWLSSCNTNDKADSEPCAWMNKQCYRYIDNIACSFMRMARNLLYRLCYTTKATHSLAALRRTVFGYWQATGPYNLSNASLSLQRTTNLSRESRCRLVPSLGECRGITSLPFAHLLFQVESYHE